LSLQSSPSGAVGTPDRGHYVVQFRRHCHELIAFGYSGIHAEDHSKSEEDYITQRLKETIKAAQRAGTLPRWADRYFITDQAPVSVPNRVGKERPKIDIEIESTESRSRPVYHFEAKRLRVDDSHSVSEYVGSEGLGSFLTELYGRSGGEGGMLGYVQSESPEHWANSIWNKIQRDGTQRYAITEDGAWTAVCLTPVLANTYATRHRRPTLGKTSIYHTLLDFRTDSSRIP
jgi:hypothetical protein